MGRIVVLLLCLMTCRTVFAVDTVFVTVRQLGGDYTALSTAESTERHSINGSDTTYVFKIDSLWTTLDNSGTVTIASSWSTTDSERVIMRTVVDSSRNTAFPYQAEVNAGGEYAINIFSGSFVFDIKTPYVTLQGIQIKGGVQVHAIVVRPTNGASEIRLENMFIQGLASGNESGVLAQQCTTIVINSLVYDCGQAGSRGGFHAESNAHLEVYNCTAANNNYGFHQTGASSEVIWKNCLGYNNSTSDFSEDGSGNTEDYNASGDATANGSNSRINQAFRFNGEDFDVWEPSFGDNGAKNHGIDLSGAVGFNDDLLGRSRTGVWDIGAFEWPGSGIFYMAPVDTISPNDWTDAGGDTKWDELTDWSDGDYVWVGTADTFQRFVLADASDAINGGTIDSLVPFWRIRKTGAISDPTVQIWQIYASDTSMSATRTFDMTDWTETRELKWTSRPGGGPWTENALDSTDMQFKMLTNALFHKAQITQAAFFVYYRDPPLGGSALLIRRRRIIIDTVGGG